MSHRIFVYIGQNALNPLIDYCRRNRLEKFLLVADDNTYPAFGQAVEETLVAAGFDVITALLTGAEVIANEYNFVQVLLNTDQQERTCLAVGSGSITDITRFVSHKTRSQFIVLPTAASVDGFTGAGAPSVIGGFKKTIMCHSPLAVFGDIDVLGAAPQAMIASGFGDMLGKYTALADWRLGALLWNEPFDEPISRRVAAALQLCVDRVDDLGAATPEGIQALMDGLIESGLCMLDANNSRPASGSEHQISHHLEMKLIWENRPAILHGAKVGAATILMAGYYQQFGRLSRQEASARLARATRPTPKQVEQEIKAAYPAIAGQVMVEQAPFMNMSNQEFERLKQKVIDSWPTIQEIAAGVPSPQQLADWLRRAGGQTSLEDFGFTPAEIAGAVSSAHLLRNRFNVDKLAQLLQIELTMSNDSPEKRCFWPKKSAFPAK